jgi:16S rRNA processing protein RimM
MMAAPQQKRDDPAAMLCLGIVGGARGLRGEVRINSYTADPADIATYGPLFDDAGGAPLRIHITGRSRNQVIARIDGVDDRDAAEALKGRHLCVSRDAFPEPGEEEFYHVDLVGLPVDHVDGDRLGVVHAVNDFGAGDVLEIVSQAGDVVMVPFTRAAVPVVDMDGGRVVVDPPPGLLDPAEPDSASDQAEEA